MKNLFRKISGRIGRTLRAGRPALVVGLSLALVAIVAANLACQMQVNGRLYTSLATVPEREVGLVLGTSKNIRRGQPNPHFTSRMDAAAALYLAGKVHHLLVSGDNRTATYDEPTDMMNALIARGVPAAAITKDCAGIRTLDSVVRAKTVFGLERCMIITEAYHCPRALWIAHNHGLDAVAFGAPNATGAGLALRATVREGLARTWCAMDLYILHRQPHFNGPKEPTLVSTTAP